MQKLPRHVITTSTRQQLPRRYTTFEVTGGKRIHLRITISEVMEAKARDLFAIKIKDYKAQSDELNEIQRALEPTPATIEVIADQALLPDNSGPRPH